MTTKETIRRWLERAEPQHTHMLVVCDTFDWEDYSVLISNKEDIGDEIVYYSKNMQKVMEVYNLSKDLEEQIDAYRSYNV